MTLEWISENVFLIDGVSFTIDTTPGSDRRPSSENNFTIVKTRDYLNNYFSIQGSFDHILELGLFQGGSLVFFDKIFNPAKLVGIEISKNKIDALEHYAESRKHIRNYYNSSQDDSRLLNKIVAEDFGGILNLVVDDASHLYELTKKSFSVLFPLLSPGGVYIIEDWAWSHRAGSQNSSHPWCKKPALTNLVFEIIVQLGSANDINEIRITNNMVIIKKSTDNKNMDRTLPDLLIRGKNMELI